MAASGRDDRQVRAIRCPAGRDLPDGADLFRRVWRTGQGVADSDIVEARFVDIVPGRRVVQAVNFASDDPAYAGTMIMTWEVTAADAGTRVDIVAENVPDAISAQEHAAGLNSSLTKLAAYLEQ